MRRPGCDGLCAVVLRDVGAEVPATVDVRSGAAILRLLRLLARLDIVPRGNVQCANKRSLRCDPEPGRGRDAVIEEERV